MARRVAVVIAVLVLLAAPAGAAERVKVGFIATFTGPLGVAGQHMIDSFMPGVDHVGGKLGGLATEVIKEDDQLKPDVGLQAAQKLIEKDKVDFVVATIFSNVMMALYKPVVDSKTFLIGSNAGPSFCQEAEKNHGEHWAPAMGDGPALDPMRNVLESTTGL